MAHQIQTDQKLEHQQHILFSELLHGEMQALTLLQKMAIFQKLNEEGHTIIMITHENDIAEHTKRIIHIKDGKIFEDSVNKNFRKAIVDGEN